MDPTAWKPDYTERALAFWHEYSATHDLSSFEGQVAAIDPVSGRVWIADSGIDVSGQGTGGSRRDAGLHHSRRLRFLCAERSTLIEGWVRKDGCPVIILAVGEVEWTAVIATGFNGDLELPPALAIHVQPQFAGRSRFTLAAGQAVKEDSFKVNFPFEGMQVRAVATFVPGNEILIGTRMLRHHELNINFVSGKVTISRAR